jgi:CRP-like cAMP-binding protein
MNKLKQMNSDYFIEYLLQFDDLNKYQIDLINSLIVFERGKEGDFYLEAGKVSNKVGFILEGAFRVFYYNDKGDEITRYFLDEQNFIVDINSFNYGIPSSEYIQSLTDSTVLTLSKESMNKLSETIVVWDTIISKITAKALSEKVARVSSMMPQDASERYEYFLVKFPNLINRIPLKYVASYLGITNHSLSRIRRNYLN